ncbi:AAA domain-containing protein [Nocardia sp. NPDC057668]|uniref:AAA domain-containing protein n=1 Tax=Nocardia sp. NPDC057668 TaxID=3346202 RepID=UPI00366ADB2B
MPSSAGSRTPGIDDLADRGARLFEYLERVQGQRVKRIRDIATYQREGEVIWFGGLPDHSAVTVKRAEPGSPFLMVQKVSVPAVPEPDPLVRPWLEKGWEQPDSEPTLRTDLVVAAGEIVRLTERADITAAFGEWLPVWREWAERAAPQLAVQRLYQKMYDMYTRYERATEAFEVVLALGFLTWKAPEIGAVGRHVLTMPVTLAFDTYEGGISVAIDPGATGYTPEIEEILDSAQLSAGSELSRAESEARNGDIDPFDRENVGALVRMFINCINSDAEYFDEMAPGNPATHPIAHYAPAVVLRNRTNRGMMRALRRIASTIRETGELPAGIHNLVDPDYRDRPTPPESSGAIVADGADKFLPLPLNDVQLRILDHVDHNAHTLVQGPPGTGKTHTAAALISHLLAQGKRVLITAHTDRALHEVRNKLPESIKQLCVSVVGDSRQELEELKTSVHRISTEAADFDAWRSRAIVDKAEVAVDRLRSRRAELNHELMRLRERDVIEQTVGDYTGTLVDIATRWRADRMAYSWIADLVSPAPGQPIPVGAADISEWRRLLLDERLADPEAATPDLVTVGELPDTERFAELCAAELAARRRRDDFARYHGDPVAVRIPHLEPPDRAQVRTVLRDIHNITGELRRHPEPWVATALNDAQAGNVLPWRTRSSTLAALIEQTDQTLVALGFADVRVQTQDSGSLLALAENLLAHIDSHGPIKTRPDGSPKVGMTSARVIKDAAPLFQAVRVDGRIPVTAEHLTLFLRAEEARRLLGKLDSAWAGKRSAPSEVLLSEHLDLHRMSHALLDRVLEFAGRLEYAGARLRELELPVPNWSDTIGVQGLLEAFDAVDAEEAWQCAQAPLLELLESLNRLPLDPRATENAHRLHRAVVDRDTLAYQRAVARLAELHGLRRAHARREELTRSLSALPLVRDAVRAQPGASDWEGRLAQFDAAWTWAGAGRWLAGHTAGDVNELCRELDVVEAGLREQATILAATRAWDQAVQRLTIGAQADLRQYAQLVKKLGKGTGQYADGKRAAISRALAKCRTSVPVWIMPIYRVVEQFDITADMFDVVVVDEASQAGVESVFLQYLAPRIVVIGDNKQVSPAAVAVNKAEIEQLALRFLTRDKYRDTWKDPQRSLFDEAEMRFPSRLTLVEHRRCVPEIIGFSNLIAYADQGVRLIPVRRFGSTRLAPIRTVFVPDAVNTARGENHAEAERVVDEIERCLSDVDYEGKTFGVISLQGAAQAKYIQRQLMLRIPPEEIERRRLHCGDAADFQGAERDVIFLSMVATGGPAQTVEATMQRYNVAVSRARDQLWLFHSVAVENLRNSEDLRFRLLDYCLGIERQLGSEDEPVQQVSENQRVEPFENLFEQQIYNRLVERGYRVTPQHTGTGYPIDLVVSGSGGQIAIECLGDRWDGSEQYRLELARQRDLERCGWPFHRIRHAEYVADADRCLGELWELLERNGIHTRDVEERLRVERLFAAAGVPVLGDSHAEALRRRVARVLAESTAVEEDSAESRLSVRAGEVEDDLILDSDEDDGAGDADHEQLETSDWTTDVSPLSAVDELPEPEPPVAVPVHAGTVVANGAESPAAPVESPVTPEPAVGDRDAVAPYVSFTGHLESPTTAEHPTIVADFLRIVAVEGPVTGARLRAAYVTAARTRERDLVRRKLDIALQAAVVTGKLLAEDPLEIDDPALWTYRLPDQPLSSRRQLGPRKVEQMPPRELAEIMASQAAVHGWSDRDALFRAAINVIGQIRLTENTITALALVLRLARGLAVRE